MLILVSYVWNLEIQYSTNLINKVFHFNFSSHNLVLKPFLQTYDKCSWSDLPNTNRNNRSHWECRTSPCPAWYRASTGFINRRCRRIFFTVSETYISKIYIERIQGSVAQDCQVRKLLYLSGLWTNTVSVNFYKGTFWLHHKFISWLGFKLSSFTIVLSKCHY